ncbi:MAG: hypothetical protein KKD39_00745 [Candidatus Altiarchaeota archaeon]|nr:hypothetical protein [Candidatus Altiarchaeota archaeon]
MGEGLKALFTERPLDADVKEILAKMDRLLGDLPPGKIAEFAKSKEFKLYQKVLKRYGVK